MHLRNAARNAPGWPVGDANAPSKEGQVVSLRGVAKGDGMLLELIGGDAKMLADKSGHGINARRLVDPIGNDIYLGVGQRSGCARIDCVIPECPVEQRRHL